MAGNGRPVAVVTGAGRGIGREVARQLAARGHTVVLAARGDRALPAAVDLVAAGHEAHALDLDITDPGSVAGAADRVGSAYGRVDVLVNNAATAADLDQTAISADLDHVREVMETNLYGTWRVTQAFLPLLKAAGRPRVVNVSSGSGSHGDPVFGLASPGGTRCAYSVSKAALNALTSALAAELAGTGILVNAVCPGLTATFAGAEELGARPVSEGAAGVVWAAMLPDDGPTGGFFRDGHPLPW
jgi:NAD(P)-dependent dehydrogenase (short-subunit alcohol dehydrogenase family)